MPCSSASPCSPSAIACLPSLPFHFLPFPSFPSLPFPSLGPFSFVSAFSQLISRGVPDPIGFNRTPTGDILFRFEPASSITARYGFPMLCIHWQEVLDVLRGMLPNDAVHTGHRLVEFTQGEEEEGSSAVKCVFKKVLGGEERFLEVELVQPRQVNTILGVNRTATAADCGAGKLFWACTLIDSADPTVSSARSKGGEEVREKILRAFEGWDVVEQVVKATPPDLILERRVLDLPPLPFWVKGRTALLGDAAHAVTPGLGQGANLAFEDAAQLVECLRGKTHVRWVLHFSGRVLHL
ncbi:unnamed protein product [Closterium sp. NIES-54]